MKKLIIFGVILFLSSCSSVSIRDYKELQAHRGWKIIDDPDDMFGQYIIAQKGDSIVKIEITRTLWYNEIIGDTIK